MRLSDLRGQEFSEGTAWMALCCTLCAGAQQGRLEAEAFHSHVWSSCQLLARPLMGLSVRINVLGVLVAVLGSPTIWRLSLTEAGERAASQLLEAGLETNISLYSLSCGSRSLPVLPGVGVKPWMECQHPGKPRARGPAVPLAPSVKIQSAIHRHPALRVSRERRPCCFTADQEKSLRIVSLN